MKKIFKLFHESYDENILIPNNSRKVLTDLCKKHGISNPFSGHTLDELIIWYHSLKPTKEKERIRNRIREIIAQAILGKLEQLEKKTQALEAVTNNFYADKLEEAVDQITQF